MGLSKSKDANGANAGRQQSSVAQQNGKPKTAKPVDDGISAADRATLQLKLQRDKLNAVLRRSTTVLAREHEQAKQLLAAGHRDRALYCLKKKKLQEAQMLQVEQMLDNIQTSLDTIEFTKLEGHVFASLREGTTTLQALQKGMSPEEVERVMDDAFDAVAISKEVTELLAARLGEEGMGAGMQLDDDALLDELLGHDEAQQAARITAPTNGVRASQDAAATAKLLNSVVLPSTAPIGADNVGQSNHQVAEQEDDDAGRVAA